MAIQAEKASSLGMTADPSSDFLYARGFLLTSRATRPPKPKWAQVKMGSLSLSYDPIQPFAMAQTPWWRALSTAPQPWVAILGCVLDTGTWQTENAIVARDAARVLARSEAALLQHIDRWNGRFLLVYGWGGKTRLMTDACAMRSAYYSFKGGLTVASHARIVADLTAAGPCPKMVESAKDERWAGSVGQFPGNATPFEDVWVLTPNTLIDGEERTVRRFFPRAPLEPLTSDQAAEIVAPILRRTAEIWATQSPVTASLTAGIDSRMTLACLRNVREKAGFFTYVAAGTRSHEEDHALASEMARELGLSHRKLDLSEGEGPVWSAFHAAHGKNVYTAHRPDVAWACLQAFPPQMVHLRSNLGEIGRGFYRRNRQLPDRISTPKALADIFKPKPMSDIPAVLEAFERFWTVTQFDLIENYDPCDLLYWEQRMSSWHSSMLLETDPAFDTRVIFNSRSVLSTLVAVPTRDKSKSKSFYRMIELLWPELLRWDVNGKPPSKLG